MQSQAKRTTLTIVTTLTMTVLAGCAGTSEKQAAPHQFSRNQVPQWAVAISEPVDLIQPETEADTRQTGEECMVIDWVPRGMSSDRQCLA